jgi:NAD(P)-dependent dehydrogenase (short-subunit alcohol dehydrogenase family)
MGERTILITGASDGLGRLVARRLSIAGATVILHGRDRGKLGEVAKDIERESPNARLLIAVADLSSLAQVRRLAADIHESADRLDVLVNNAGVAGLVDRQLSADGYELHFAVNYLAGFLLTSLLLPLVQRSAPARIVNVSSKGQHQIDFTDVMLERDYDQLRAYRQSKLAQILFTFELHERLRRRGDARITINAIHPATLMDTKLVKALWGAPLTSIEDGAEAVLRLIDSAAVAGTSGRYFEGFSEATALPQAYNREDRFRLWQLSEELVKC